jgi:hypothetical protein
MRNETATYRRSTASRPAPLSEPPGKDQPSPVNLLALQFLAWVEVAPRTYADVMDAWRSTCPRQSVWEDMTIGGLVAFVEGTQRIVLTARGLAAIAASRSQDRNDGGLA